MRARSLSILTAALLLGCAVDAWTQEQINRQFDTAEEQLGSWVEENWKDHTRDCVERIRQSISSQAEAISYIECVYGVMPHFIRDWHDRQRNEVNTIVKMFEELYGQIGSEGQETAGNQANLAGLGTYAYNRFAAWHQRMATMVVELNKAGFFSGPETSGIVEDIQKSLERVSTSAKAYVAAIQQDPSAMGTKAKELFSTFAQAFNESAPEIITRVQLVFINAVNRHRNQTIRLLEQSDADYTQLADTFDEFTESTFKPLKECAANVWTRPQQ